MIKTLYGRDLAQHQKLQATMFQDRAKQFVERLKWDALHVDENGWERDDYDHDETLYVIYQNPDGSHGGSLRFLPLDGKTMVNDHFLELIGGSPIKNPHIWECTRFCLSPGARPNVSASLMLAGGELMKRHGLTHLLGIYDAHMLRVYKRIGSKPEILGSKGEGRDKICVGLWAYRDEDVVTLQNQQRRYSAKRDISQANPEFA